MKRDSRTTQPTARTTGFGSFLLLLGAGVLFYRFGEQWLRSVLLYLSTAGWARSLVTSFPPAWLVAKRFVAGESVDEAIDAVRRLNAKGLSATLDYLGESVQDAREATAAREQILLLLDRIHQAGVQSNVSLKLSQLGLKLDENMAVDNLRQILQRAAQYGNRVRVDMEESAVLDTTLDIYRRLRHGDGFQNVGVVLQSYLYRTDEKAPTRSRPRLPTRPKPMWMPPIFATRSCCSAPKPARPASMLPSPPTMTP
jgi:proline dehydrogenase